MRPAHIILLLCMLVTIMGAGVILARRPRGLPTDARSALPALPDLATQPTELRERLLRAHARALNSADPLEAFAEMGRLFHANGYSAEAEACWQLLAAEEPGNARWTYFLADLRRLASDNPGMAALLARTVERAPDYSPAWLHFADLKFKTGETAEAERGYRKRLELVPGDPYARLGLVRVALQQGRRDEARRQVEQLVADSPLFSPGQNLYAEILAADGDTARAALARVAGRDAGRFRAAEDPWLDELADWCFDYERLCIRGTVDNQTKHGDRGKAAFERAIQVRPGALPAYELLGNLYLELNDAEQARATYERGLERAPDAKPSAGLYVNLGRAYRLMKQPAEAVRVCRAGLARVGEAYELYDALGTALLELGEHEAALAALRVASDRNPTAAAAHYNLAVALIGMKRLDEAVAALHRSIAAQPTFPQALALLAQIEIDSGRWLGALKYLQPLYESHPGLPEAREKMTYYYLHAGIEAEKAKDTAAAEKHYRAGLAIEPDRAELHVRLGVLCLLQRRFADAIAPLEAHHRLQPDDSRGALYLGQAYAAVGRRAEARNILEKGVELAERAGNAATAQHCRDTLRRLP